MRAMDTIMLIVWFVGTLYMVIFADIPQADKEMLPWFSTVIFAVYLVVSFLIKRFFLKKQYGDEFEI